MCDSSGQFMRPRRLGSQENPEKSSFSHLIPLPYRQTLLVFGKNYHFLKNLTEYCYLKDACFEVQGATRYHIVHLGQMKTVVQFVCSAAIIQFVSKKVLYAEYPRFQALTIE